MESMTGLAHAAVQLRAQIRVQYLLNDDADAGKERKRAWEGELKYALPL
jgi:hypothetical protein